MLKTNLTLILTMLALAGCAMLPTPATRTNQVQRLRSHPQYQTALMAAPEWCRDALTTINDLELALKKAEAK